MSGQEQYLARVTERRQKQDQQWATVQELPLRAQAGALFALWPEKLPKRVRSVLPREVLQEWRALRTNQHDLRWEKRWSEMAAGEDEMNQEALKAILLQEYEIPVQQLLTVLRSMSQLKKITSVMGDNVISIEFPAVDDPNAAQVWEELTLLLAVSLHNHAGVMIRQSSHLRSQIIDAAGQKQWVQQERVYGIFCAGEQWTACTEAQVRSAYNTDAGTGKPLPRDPTITFGNMKEVVRKALGAEAKHH